MFFRFLLRLYPPLFRENFGEEMLSVFAEAEAEASSKGFAEHTTFYLRETLGLACGGIRARLRSISTCRHERQKIGGPMILENRCDHGRNDRQGPGRLALLWQDRQRRTATASAVALAVVLWFDLGNRCCVSACLDGGSGRMGDRLRNAPHGCSTARQLRSLAAVVKEAVSYQLSAIS